MKNTFDFFNYNYSALISIFAAMMGMAYPLILQAVQRVDDMYQSTSLSKYVHHQSEFRHFNNVLVISVCISIIAPFIIHAYANNPTLAFCVEAFHTLVITALLYCAIKLFNFILITTRPSEFLKHIKASHSEGQPVLLECFQIAKYASNHESIQLFMEAMDFIREESASYFNRSKYKGDEETLFFRQYVDVLEEMRKQLSKEDGGYFETYDQLVPVYYSDRKFSEIDQLGYNKMWQTLDVVSYNHKNAYFKKYWRKAEEYYLGNVDDKYNPLSGEDKDCIASFREFHFMLGAMLVHRKQWDLLSQILMPVEVERNETYLVPTRITNLLTITQSLLDQNAPGRELSFRFQMIGMEEYRFKDEIISNAIFTYSSILFIRLWLVGQYYHRDSKALQMSLPEDVLGKNLYRMLKTLNRIRSEIDKWFKNENLETLKLLVPLTVTQSQIVSKLDEYRGEIIAKIKKMNIAAGTSLKKIENLKDALISEMKEKDSLLPMSNNSLSNEDTPEILHAYYGVTIEQNAIDEKMNGTPASTASFVITRLCSQLWSCYRRKFVLEPPRTSYAIYIKEFFDALSRLNVDSSYAILLSYLSPEFISSYYAQSNNLTKDAGGRFYFNGAPIYSFPFDNKYRALVVKQSVLPYVEVMDSEKAEEELTEIGGLLRLSTNADSLKADSDEEKRLLKVARNYRIHSSKDFMRYTELEFIMRREQQSNIDSIKPLMSV